MKDDFLIGDFTIRVRKLPDNLRSADQIWQATHREHHSVGPTPEAACTRLIAYIKDLLDL